MGKRNNYNEHHATGLYIQPDKFYTQTRIKNCESQSCKNWGLSLGCKLKEVKILDGRCELYIER